LPDQRSSVAARTSQAVQRTYSMLTP
jgi:hypothetical protein